MIYLPTFPLFWTLFGLIGPFKRRAKTDAGKNPVLATVPTEYGYNGSPAARYVHEVGGLRFDILCGALAGWLTAAGLIIGEVADPIVLTAIPAAVSFGVTAMMVATEVTDIAEHGAEIMRGAQQADEPEMKLWLKQQGFRTYTQAEIHRLVTDGDRNWNEAQVRAALAKWRWLSRIILPLGSW